VAAKCAMRRKKRLAARGGSGGGGGGRTDLDSVGEFMDPTKRHIEFRQHYGTTDAQSAVMWVQIMTRFVSQGGLE
jgi:hypothetical protein